MDAIVAVIIAATAIVMAVIMHAIVVATMDVMILASIQEMFPVTTIARTIFREIAILCME